MEILADHYGIPSVNFAVPVVQLEQAGKLIYQSEEPATEGVIRFSTDGVHPLDEEHVAVIEIHPNQPDRMPVAFRLKDPEAELKTEKYQGTCMRVGQILGLGDVLN